jgi:prevent-host-death family protein
MTAISFISWPHFGHTRCSFGINKKLGVDLVHLLDKLCPAPPFHASLTMRRKQYITIDLDMFKAYNMVMKIANIAEFKNHLSSYLAAVEAGEEVEVRKRNVPVARVVPVINNRKNRTMLGCGRGSAETVGDLTEPQIPESDWEFLGDSSG